MDKISEHFSRHEFACSCGCGFAAVDVELLEVLERLRTLAASPIRINSACRCSLVNQRVGGSPGSFHKKGMAADIVVKNHKPSSIAEVLDDLYPNQYGIGTYPTFVHLDVRQNGPVRWAK